MKYKNSSHSPFTFTNGKRAFWFFLLVVNILGFVQGDQETIQIYAYIGFIAIVLAGIFNVVSVSDD